MTWICVKKERRVAHRSRQSASGSMIGPTRSPNAPEEHSASNIAADEFDHLIGDGLRVKKSVNRDSLWIKGDGCRVSLATNIGKIRVSGDGCRVHIGRNLGSVEYNGDGGHIVLGPESTPDDRGDRIVYRGDGGLIDFAGKRKYFDKSNGGKETTAATKTTTSSGGKSLSGRADMRTKVVGSSNVQIHFDLRIHDKSSR